MGGGDITPTFRRRLTKSPTSMPRSCGIALFLITGTALMVFLFQVADLASYPGPTVINFKPEPPQGEAQAVLPPQPAVAGDDDVKQPSELDVPDVVGTDETEPDPPTATEPSASRKPAAKPAPPAPSNVAKVETTEPSASQKPAVKPAVKVASPAPQAVVPAPTACSYDHICPLEKAGKYEEAFRLYEEAAAKCGTEPWTTIKVLGAGLSGRARLLRTPCGLELAAKEPPANGNSVGSFKMLRDHIEVSAVVGIGGACGACKGLCAVGGMRSRSWSRQQLFSCMRQEGGFFRLVVL